MTLYMVIISPKYGLASENYDFLFLKRFTQFSNCDFCKQLGKIYSLALGMGLAPNLAKKEQCKLQSTCIAVSTLKFEALPYIIEMNASK